MTNNNNNLIDRLVESSIEQLDDDLPAPVKPAETDRKTDDNGVNTPTADDIEKATKAVAERWGRALVETLSPNQQMQMQRAMSAQRRGRRRRRKAAGSRSGASGPRSAGSSPQALRIAAGGGGGNQGQQRKPEPLQRLQPSQQPQPHQQPQPNNSGSGTAAAIAAGAAAAAVKKHLDAHERARDKGQVRAAFTNLSRGAAHAMGTEHEHHPDFTRHAERVHSEVTRKATGGLFGSRSTNPADHIRRAAADAVMARDDLSPARKAGVMNQVAGMYMKGREPTPPTAARDPGEASYSPEVKVHVNDFASTAREFIKSASRDYKKANPKPRPEPKPAEPQPVNSSDWTGRVTESWTCSEVEVLAEWLDEDIDDLQVEIFQHNLPLVLIEGATLAAVYHDLAHRTMKTDTVWEPGKDTIVLSRDVLGPELAKALEPEKDTFGLTDFPGILKAWCAKWNLPAAAVIELLTAEPTIRVHEGRFVCEYATSNADKDLVPLPGQGIDNPEFETSEWDDGIPNEEEPVDGSTSSIIDTEPVIEPDVDDGKHLHKDHWFRDPRKQDPRQFSKHPIRKRLQRMYGPQFFDGEQMRIYNDVGPTVSQSKHLEMLWDGGMDQDTMDLLLQWLIDQQRQRDLTGVYARVIHQSGMSIEDAIEALRAYRRQRLGWKGDGSNELIEPGTDGATNFAGGAVQS